MKIQYIERDITDPIETNTIVLILHVCNDSGLMGSGVAYALFKKWPNVRSDYIEWFNFETDNPITDDKIKPFKIGRCQLVEVAPPNIYVINMIGQNGLRGYGNPIPINYSAIDSCLQEVERLATEMGKYFGRDVVVNMPRIGCGLAGGSWDKIEPLILKNIKHSVTIYDYE